MPKGGHSVGWGSEAGELLAPIVVGQLGRMAFAHFQGFDVNTFAGLTVAYWCVVVAAMLPIVCAGIAKWGMLGVSRRNGGYDNHLPRSWLGSQSGWRARANAAQANSFEALPFFIGAVIIAHQAGSLQVRVDLLALVFVLLRLVYILLYVADQANARSVVWTLALITNLSLLFV
jgi:uncharacterized MAPEG superfamily protein